MSPKLACLWSVQPKRLIGTMCVIGALSLLTTDAFARNTFANAGQLLNAMKKQSRQVSKKHPLHPVLGKYRSKHTGARTKFSGKPKAEDFFSTKAKIKGTLAQGDVGKLKKTLRNILQVHQANGRNYMVNAVNRPENGFSSPAEVGRLARQLGFSKKKAQKLQQLSTWGATSLYDLR